MNWRGIRWYDHESKHLEHDCLMDFMRCDEERLLKSPFFAECDAGFLTRLIKHLSVELFTGNDARHVVLSLIYCLLSLSLHVLHI